ncbi:hypothetical protein F5Y17DRAFT_286367 [Xylariaceae sp. FL0594]|nr:hypothetical protein F5Y17DRAFT_286367 [Xylariaceae sp. FL0594]
MLLVPFLFRSAFSEFVFVTCPCPCPFTKQIQWPVFSGLCTRISAGYMHAKILCETFDPACCRCFGLIFLTDCLQLLRFFFCFVFCFVFVFLYFLFFIFIFFGWGKAQFICFALFPPIYYWTSGLFDVVPSWHTYHTLFLLLLVSVRWCS